jgi:hypothetical protein
MHALRDADDARSPRVPVMTMAESTYCSNNVKTKGGGWIATPRGRSRV